MEPRPRRAAAPGWALDAWYLVLALVLVPAGGVVAWSHLSTEGWSGTGAMGALAAAVGVVCGWRGVGGVWRRLRVGGRVLAGIVTLVLLYVWVLPWGIAVYATVPPNPGASDARPVIDGQRAEAVRFPSAGAVTLAGWYLYGSNGATVVLLPGSSSTVGSVERHAAELHDAGFSVLAYDARGHGRSEGRAMELGWDAEADVSAAVSYLIDERSADPDRIGAVGLSLGGEVAIGAAASDDRLSAVVAEGAGGRSAQDHTWLADAYGVRGEVQVAVDRFTYWLVDLLSPAPGPPSPMRADVRRVAPRPVLLVAAGDDPDEQRVAEGLREASPSNVETWTCEGAGHTGALAAAPQGWRRRVVGFLRRHL